MSVNTDFVAALPVTGSAVKALLRNALVTRQPYVLADTDLPTDLIAVDPASGAAILDLFYLGRNFHYDSTDTTTANDGVSCLVSNEGRRYKLSDAAGVFAFAVLNATTSVPPVSPSIGDAYLVASGATGAWAGQDNNVATRTRRGWEFITYGVGRLLYVENTDSYMHKTSGGAWELGFGTQALTLNSVPITAVIGANASFVVRVENQTTNAPPSSPVVPTAYIIGPSPTGSWAGFAGRLAICDVAGSFTVIQAVTGDTLFDKSLGVNVTFNGTAWVSSAGSWIGRAAVQTASGGTTAASATTAYTYSSGTPPTTSQRRLVDNATLTYTAKRSGSTLRFHYVADVVYTPGVSGPAATSGNFVAALFRDAGSNAIDWQRVSMVAELLTAGAASVGVHLDHWFEIAAPDTASHTYTIALTSTYSAANNLTDPTTPTRRTLEVEEST